MIPFDFVYCRPDTLSEAAAAYAQMEKDGLSPVYYGGGSEIITMCRSGSFRPGAVIDLKAIPECLMLEQDQQRLTIGASNTLNSAKESKLFPLLGTTCGRIADHTNQCRITLGGNLCGTIIYRETSLPLLLCGAEAVLFGPNGTRTAPFFHIFRQRLLLESGEFLVQVQIPVKALHLPYVHIKKTAQEKIDYPLVNVTAVADGGMLRAAFTGICSFPFRSLDIEQVLSDRAKTPQARADAVPALLPELPYSDSEGSGAYRLFVLKHILIELLEEWDRGEI